MDKNTETITASVSAETLRRAAALMRERVEAATPGPWGTSWDKQVIAAYGSPSDGEQLADAFDSADNAAHIASWHPAVALAVADWLDAEFDHQFGPTAEAIDVARAYLGESA